MRTRRATVSPDRLAPSRSEFESWENDPEGVVHRERGEETETMANQQRRQTADDRSGIFRLAMIATGVGLLIAAFV